MDLIDGQVTEGLTGYEPDSSSSAQCQPSSDESIANVQNPNVSGSVGDVKRSSPENSMEKEIRRLQAELDEARSLVAVANYSLEESLETERRKCQEEVATLQQLMKGILTLDLLFMAGKHLLSFSHRKCAGSGEDNCRKERG